MLSGDGLVFNPKIDIRWSGKAVGEGDFWHVARVPNDEPLRWASSSSGSSSNSKLSKSTFRSLCSKARVQCAMICTISATKVSSGEILEYQVCT